MLHLYSNDVAPQDFNATLDKRSHVTPKEEHEVTGVVSGGYRNPLGRASVTGPVAPAGADQEQKLAQGSIVGIKRTSLSPGAQSLAVRALFLLQAFESIGCPLYMFKPCQVRRCMCLPR